MSRGKKPILEFGAIPIGSFSEYNFELGRFEMCFPRVITRRVPRNPGDQFVAKFSYYFKLPHNIQSLRICHDKENKVEDLFEAHSYTPIRLPFNNVSDAEKFKRNVAKHKVENSLKIFVVCQNPTGSSGLGVQCIPAQIFIGVGAWVGHLKPAYIITFDDQGLNWKYQYYNEF